MRVASSWWLVAGILPDVPEQPKIAIIGLGRLGTVLAHALNNSGYPISEVVTRAHARNRLTPTLKAKLLSHPSPLQARVIWFCVPDSEIVHAARSWSHATEWKGRVAFHASGALTSDELDALRKRGAAVASVHPHMTFVSGATPSLKGVPFAVEGDPAAVRMAKRIVRNLGGQVFVISKEHKPAYHAWGAFTSPLLVALLVTAEQVAELAGVSAKSARKRMLPILHQTLQNYAALGPAAASSGPIVRGDAEVVRKHLQILQKTPDARNIYRALAHAALRRLPARNRNALRQLLAARHERKP